MDLISLSPEAKLMQPHLLGANCLGFCASAGSVCFKYVAMLSGYAKAVEQQLPRKRPDFLFVTFQGEEAGTFDRVEPGGDKNDNRADPGVSRICVE